VLKIEPELEKRMRTDFPEVLNKLYTNDVEKIRKNITRLIANLKPFRFNNMTRKRRQKALNNAKAKAKRMNDNLSPGEKKHYGLKYVVVPVKNKKFIN
jgi:hypothetical protein